MKTIRKLLSLSKKSFLGKLSLCRSIGLIPFAPGLSYPFSGKTRRAVGCSLRWFPDNKTSLDHLSKSLEGAAAGRSFVEVTPC